MSDYDAACADITHEVVGMIDSLKRVQRVLWAKREHWDEQYYSGICDAILKLTKMLPGK